MKYLTLIVVSFTFLTSFGQRDTSINTRPAQVTFFYPLGTNGIATDYTNMVSFNILYGINGGLNGVELGGLVNSNVSHVNGIQIGGLANVNGKAANGLMIGGIANFIGDTSNAICIAGISNVMGGSSVGLHTAGISNTVNGDYLGGQLSGITNITNGDFEGAQITGISNVINGDFKGAQVAGVTNVVKGDVKGAQIGLINSAKNVNGFQLGLINVSDSVTNGVPLGLISFVRNGYHALELEAGETIYSNLNLKLGVDRLYTIYKAGFTINKGNQYWSYGVGLGTKMKFTTKLDFSVDLSTNHIVEKSYSPRFNLMTKLDAKLRYNIGEYFTLFAGPSLVNYISEHDTDTENSLLSVPYSIAEWSWQNNNGKTYMWIGANAGIAFKF